MFTFASFKTLNDFDLKCWNCKRPSNFKSFNQLHYMSVNRREKENSCRVGNDHKLKKGEIVASIIEPMCLCLIYEIMRELELLVLYVYIWKTKLFCLLCHVVNCTSSNLIPLLCGCEIAKQKLSLDSIALQHFSFFILLLWVTGKMNSRTEGWNSFFSFSEMRTKDSS